MYRVLATWLLSIPTLFLVGPPQSQPAEPSEARTITTLRRQVRDLKRKVKSLSKENENLKAANSELQGEINKLRKLLQTTDNPAHSKKLYGWKDVEAAPPKVLEDMIGDRFYGEAEITSIQPDSDQRGQLVISAKEPESVMVKRRPDDPWKMGNRKQCEFSVSADIGLQFRTGQGITVAGTIERIREVRDKGVSNMLTIVLRNVTIN